MSYAEMDARPRGELEQAADLLTKLTGNLAQLRRGIQEIGTPRDGPAVRSRLRSVREQSSTSLQEVMAILQRKQKVPLDGMEKRKLGKVLEQQKAVVTDYQVVEREYLAKEKSFPLQASSAQQSQQRVSAQQVGYQPPNEDIRVQMYEEENQGRQLSAATRQTIDRENAAELAAAQRDLVMLSGMVMEVNQMVRDQGILVDEIEANTDVAADNASAGTSELGKAREYLKSYRCKCCILWTIIFIIIGVIVTAVAVKLSQR
eukprot:TRINITY_DN6433_c0_g1_i1.p1 TRINITY_DN6433_c0_g1~~TRINITY_DN6433_c0_g1_i1.p1  ORF type:complete len:260 (-),score=56.81 TRINITY_DN6433_c0_g1_i1:194-973(-)